MPRRPLPLAPTRIAVAILLSTATIAGCHSARPSRELAPWEAGNPLVALPEPPAGLGPPPLRPPETEAGEPHASDAVGPLDPTPETVRLGKWLFFDGRLSADGTISCASCHRPEHGFSEPRATSIGIGGAQGTRKAQPILNAAWQRRFFWDGRAASLEEQAIGPITNPLEMGHTEASLVSALARIPGYGRHFAEAFGDERVTMARIARALAHYQRTRYAGHSAWDRWREGDQGALSARARAGAALFFGRAGCHQCHLGPNLTDGAFHNTGVGWDAVQRRFTDVGRAAITGAAADRGAFKTPSLRDVARRAPYMHDGSIASLGEAVRFYNRGGRPNPGSSARLVPLGLTDAEIDALVAFLEGLDSKGAFESPPTRFPQ